MTQFGHVCLNVENMDEAIEFYEGVLQLQLAKQDGDRWAEFNVGGVTLALSAGRDDSVTQPFNGHVAFRVTDVREWMHDRDSRLDGIEVKSGRHEDMLVLRDPGGHTIIVYSPHLA